MYSIQMSYRTEFSEAKPSLFSTGSRMRLTFWLWWLMANRCVLYHLFYFVAHFCFIQLQEGVPYCRNLSPEDGSTANA
jgi:hypothetical protein